MTVEDQAADQPALKVTRPLYPRLLRLRHLELNAWQRAVLGEGAVAFALLLVAADLATAWSLLVLPVAVAVVVKANDLAVGLLRSDDSVEPVDPEMADPHVASPEAV